MRQLVQKEARWGSEGRRRRGVVVRMVAPGVRAAAETRARPLVGVWRTSTAGGVDAMAVIMRYGIRRVRLVVKG